MSSRVEDILESLTLEEKISLTAGKDFWETVPIPEKGVPAIKVWKNVVINRYFQLIPNRQVMDRTGLAERFLQGELGRPASRLLSAQQQPGIQNSQKE